MSQKDEAINVVENKEATVVENKEATVVENKKATGDGGYTIELVENNYCPSIKVEGVTFEPGVVFAMDKLSKKVIQKLINCNYLSEDKKTGLQYFAVKKLGM